MSAEQYEQSRRLGSADEHLTCNERLTARGITHRPAGGIYHSYLDHRGNEIARLTPYEASLWMSAGCPRPASQWAERIRSNQRTSRIASFFAQGAQAALRVT